MIITEVHTEASLIIWVSFKRESRYYIINYNFKILKGMYVSNYIVKSLWSEVKWSEMKSLSHVRLFVTPWTVAYQAPPSMRFSRQEYWRGLPFPSPGDLPNSGTEPGSPALQAYALPSKPPGNWWVHHTWIFFSSKYYSTTLLMVGLIQGHGGTMDKECQL